MGSEQWVVGSASGSVQAVCSGLGTFCRYSLMQVTLCNVGGVCSVCIESVCVVCLCV